MKHSDFPFGGGLPDAPLAMPKQSLEWRRPLIVALLSVFTAWQR